MYLGFIYVALFKNRIQFYFLAVLPVENICFIRYVDFQYVP